MCLRRWRSSPTAARLGAWGRAGGDAALVAGLAYSLAVAEAASTASFRHYVVADRGRLYTVGCALYAAYFVVSFPMYARLDEGAGAPARGRPGAPWTLGRTVVDALSACMLVTSLLEAVRLALGTVGRGPG